MVRLSIVAVMLLVACNRHESHPPPPKPTESKATSKVGSPVARGTLKQTKIETAYLVVAAADSNLAALEKLSHEKGPSLDVTRVSLADLFDVAQLTFLTRDLPEADAARMKASSSVLRVHGSGTDGIKVTREIAGVTRDVADAAHGWVIDPETYQIFSAIEFHDHVPGDHPDVRRLIVVHSIVGGNEQPFLDTAGLHRYGFPDLYFAETASGDITQISHLLNGAAQTLLDGGDVNERGEIAVDFKKLGWDMDTVGTGTGKAVLKTRWAKESDAGDDDELVVELVPPSGAGTESAAKLVDECFGHKPDKITMLDGDDPELKAAAERARADLAKLRSHFAKGIPVDERLIVKAKFTGSEDQVEWMWVDVVAFRGNAFEGTLANDPELIKSLHDGQKVKVKLSDVGDYLHDKDSGEKAGGYSIELMKKRGLLSEDAE